MEFSDYTFEPLTSAMHDVSEIKKEYGRQQGIRAVDNLKKNFFNAVYADNIDEARSVILDLISDGAPGTPTSMHLMPPHFQPSYFPQMRCPRCCTPPEAPWKESSEFPSGSLIF